MPLTSITDLSSHERQQLKSWLVAHHTTTGAPSYSHIHITENRSNRETARPILLKYLKVAHEDARRYFRFAYRAPLDPRRAELFTQAHENYPVQVGDITLAGLFGEVFAALVAELYAPHSEQWLIPAFCFRAHSTVFAELIRAALKGTNPRATPGRLGDDCLAFAVDSNNLITAVLAAEAKCSFTHRRQSINEGHKSLSERDALQLEYFRLIETLRAGGGATHEWISAIEAFRDAVDEAQKKDLLLYAYGTPPKRSRTWISVNKKHRKHVSLTHLVSAEVCITELKNFILSAYRDAFS